MRYLFTCILLITLAACNNAGNTSANGDSTVATSSNGTISETRENPKSAPVKTLEKKVSNDLNNWFFRVQLFETNKRFVYNLVMQYEEIKEAQEIAFPNFNIEPRPEIRSGSKEYEAIIGFLDDKGDFREYLSVYVENNKLQLKQLKHYAVYQNEKK